MPENSLNRAVSVAMVPWTLEHQVFAFETYIETKSIITVQRRFRIHFNVERRGTIPDRNTIRR